MLMTLLVHLPHAHVSPYDRSVTCQSRSICYSTLYYYCSHQMQPEENAPVNSPAL